MITLVPIGGFLGAGKTTAILAAARHLERAGHAVAIVTNDQGEDLVDTALARAAALPVGEVTGGCFCCRFDRLVDVVGVLARDHRADFILAEAVGSCTDLAATVVRPLTRDHAHRIRVAPLTVMVDPARDRALGRARRPSGWFPARLGELVDPTAYLFRKQLEEAELIVLTKMELLSGRERETTCARLAAECPSATIMTASSTTGAGVAALVEAWQSMGSAPERDVEVDYDLYAEAEARFAWLNAACEVRAEQGTLTPDAWVESCLRALEAEVASAAAVIGHVKIHCATADGVTQASLVGASSVPAFALRHATSARSARVLVNVRVQIAPAHLRRALETAIAHADARSRAETSVIRLECFSPARPRPMHRVSARTTV